MKKLLVVAMLVGMVTSQLTACGVGPAKQEVKTAVDTVVVPSTLVEAESVDYESAPESVAEVESIVEEPEQESQVEESIPYVPKEVILTADEQSYLSAAKVSIEWDCYASEELKVRFGMGSKELEDVVNKFVGGWLMNDVDFSCIRSGMDVWFKVTDIVEGISKPSYAKVQVSSWFVEPTDYILFEDLSIVKGTIDEVSLDGMNIDLAGADYRVAQWKSPSAPVESSEPTPSVQPLITLDEWKITHRNERNYSEYMDEVSGGMSVGGREIGWHPVQLSYSFPSDWKVQKDVYKGMLRVANPDGYEFVMWTMSPESAKNEVFSYTDDRYFNDNIYNVGSDVFGSDVYPSHWGEVKNSVDCVFNGIDGNDRKFVAQYNPWGDKVLEPGNGFMDLPYAIYVSKVDAHNTMFVGVFRPVEYPMPFLNSGYSFSGIDQLQRDTATGAYDGLVDDINEYKSYCSERYSAIDSAFEEFSSYFTNVVYNR